MKKILMMLMLLAPMAAFAQKFGHINAQEVMAQMPEFIKARGEVEALNTEASTMYKNYQNELVFLSQEQKKARQEAIMKKEKEASDLKRKYFGPEGELFKKRESLMSPIQDEIYNTVKEISELRGYSLVLDRASESAGIIFGSPKIDISNEVLQKLGYN